MLNKIMEWSVRHVFLVLLGTLFVVAWGVYTVIHTPVDAIPDLSDTQVIVYGALTSRTWKIRWNTDDAQWKAVFGPSTKKRWIMVFFGAIILEYGAGIAGGCTSGLVISGGMLLVPAAFLFMGAMFMSGILTSLIIYRGRY